MPHLLQRFLRPKISVYTNIYTRVECNGVFVAIYQLQIYTFFSHIYTSLPFFCRLGSFSFYRAIFQYFYFYFPFHCTFLLRLEGSFCQNNDIFLEKGVFTYKSSLSPLYRPPLLALCNIFDLSFLTNSHNGIVAKSPVGKSEKP